MSETVTSSVDCGPGVPGFARDFVPAPGPGSAVESHLFAGDEPDGGVEPEVVPGPIQEHGNAVAETDQLDQVHAQPHEPGQWAGNADGPNLAHGGVPANGGQRAFIPIAESPRNL